MTVLFVLRLAFLAVLYLFLLVVARAAWRSVQPGTGAPPPVIELTVIDPARSRRHAGERVVVSAGGSVGREPGNSLVIDEDTVSARHAVFHLEHGRWWLEDLHSTNGTFVNRRPVDGRHALQEGDEIYFGRVALRFGHSPNDAKG